MAAPPTRSPRMSKRAWRTSEVVGRSSRPRAVSTWRPRHWPAVIRVSAICGTDSVEVEHGTVAVHRLRQGRVLDQVRVVLQPGGGGIASARVHGEVEQVGDAHLGETVLAQAGEVSGATQPEVELGELEAARSGGDGAEPLGTGIVGAALEEQAGRGVLAAADPAAELMELGDAEPLRALDEHDRRVGDVDADLDDAGGDEQVGVTRGEAGHPLLLLPSRHPAVEQLDAQ